MFRCRKEPASGAGGGHFRRVRGELQDGFHLLTRNSEFLDDFVNAHVLKVLENSRNRRASAPVR